MIYNYFNKRIVIMLIFTSIVIILTSCSRNVEKSNGSNNTLPSNNKTTISPSISGDRAKTDINLSSSENVDSNTPINTDSSNQYTMLVYTEAANDKSSIYIQYPIFSGDDYKVLNTMIYDKVVSIGQLDPNSFSKETGLTADYQSEVTLLNNRVVSIVFWGTSYVEGGAYPTSNLYTLNVDLNSMKEIKLDELYTMNDEFEKIFFEKATFPTEPITSYDIDSFPEMLKLQSEDYQTENQFKIKDGVRFYLKPDGIVLSLSAIHATGSDHFEAFLLYSDIEEFYLPSQKYWEVE